MLARDVVLVVTVTFLVAFVLDVAFFRLPAPRSAPDQLVLWGHTYTPEGGCCASPQVVAPPVPRTAIRPGEDVRVIDPAFGTIGLLPISLEVWGPADIALVYYRVGADAYVPYRQAGCCESG